MLANIFLALNIQGQWAISSIKYQLSFFCLGKKILQVFFLKLNFYKSFSVPGVFKFYKSFWDFVLKKFS